MITPETLYVKGEQYIDQDIHSRDRDMAWKCVYDKTPKILIWT